MEMNNLKWEIGQRVRECRLDAGYTQAQCAEVMDTALYNDTNGKRFISRGSFRVV